MKVVLRSAIAIIYILSFLVILHTTTFAQAPEIQWTKTFGDSLTDVGNSVQQTIDGGFIVIGETRFFGASASDVWLIRTDSYGDTLWTQTFGRGVTVPFTGRESGSSAEMTSDGGYIIAGSWGTGNSYFSGNIVLIKTNTNGESLWMRHFGGEGSRGVSSQQTADGGYIIAGHNWYNAILIKTDANGDTLWTKMFEGGSVVNGSRSVQQTSDGGYVLCGFSYGSGDNDAWLIKTDANGDTLWTKTFGGDSSDVGYSIQQTSDGGYVLCGYTNSYGSGDFDAWLIKTDANGDTLWTKTIGDTGCLDWGNSVQQTSDGGYIVAGSKDGDVLLVKVAPDITSIDENPNVALNNYQLHQNYPNPYNPSTTIEFALPKSEYVELKVYNLLGKEVTTLVSEKLNQGNHTYQFDGKNLASGVYYYRIEAGNFVQTRKMIYLK
jgi:hypothetical protein